MSDYESRLARDREAGYVRREQELTTEVARLREALERISAWTSDDSSAVYGTAANDRLIDIGLVARTALAAGKREGG